MHTITFIITGINVDAPTIDEVRRAVQKLENEKSPGLDGISPEALKAGGESLVERLCELLGTIWSTETVPQEWRDGLIVPLHKKGKKLCAQITEVLRYYRSRGRY